MQKFFFQEFDDCVIFASKVKLSEGLEEFGQIAFERGMGFFLCGFGVAIGATRITHTSRCELTMSLRPPATRSPPDSRSFDLNSF